MGSLIIGWVLVGIGSLAAVVGIVVVTLTAFRGADGAGAFGATVLRLGELLKGLLAELSKFTVGVQVLILGLLCIGGGAVLIAKRPF